MELARLTRKSPVEWWIAPHGPMQVPGVIYASESLVRDMDVKVYEQIVNVAALPGIERAAYAMPDAHWGYGFPIGGVAAFDPEAGGIVSAGGVGFDISCGVRLLRTGVAVDVIERIKHPLADALFRTVPAGLGSIGHVHLDREAMHGMLTMGARWAVMCGFGTAADLDRIEEGGCMAGAQAGEVSDQAKARQRDEMGTLGSGNHYVEVQRITHVFDRPAADAFQLGEGDIVVSIHCGSRGLGHQIGSEFLQRMSQAAGQYHLSVPDRELACAPVKSSLGEAYLGAMRAAINCAFANRQILTQLVRDAFASVLPDAALTLVYDVSHNTCKLEEHRMDGYTKRLFVHRKGATRAFGPGHPDLPPAFAAVGQPVLIGGTMGTASYVLVGTAHSDARAFGSSCHGAGRSMSRHQALKQWRGREVVDELATRGIVVRGRSPRGIAEEAPGAYKDVAAVVDAADEAGLSRKVARLEPVVCIKG